MDRKDLVVATATKLFYDNGLIATSYKDIANEMNCTVGVITNYFDSKQELARAVYNRYTNRLFDDVMEKVLQQFGSMDVLPTFAIISYVRGQLYYNDEHARRFYYEYATTCFESIIMDDPDNASVKYQRFFSSKKKNSDLESKFGTYLSRGCYASLFCAFYSGTVSCTFEEYFEKIVKEGYRNLGVDDNIANASYQKAMVLIKKIDYKIEPYFRIK